MVIDRRDEEGKPFVGVGRTELRANIIESNKYGQIDVRIPSIWSIRGSEETMNAISRSQSLRNGPRRNTKVCPNLFSTYFTQIRPVLTYAETQPIS